MSLYQQIRDNRMTAMKSKMLVAKSILTTLLGEVETKAKREGCDVSDEIVIQTCKKFISANNELVTKAGLLSTDPRFDVCSQENKILTEFLPKQLTESEIVAIIKSLGATNVGKVMGHFKANYSGKVDNAVASRLAREMTT